MPPSTSSGMSTSNTCCMSLAAAGASVLLLARDDGCVVSPCMVLLVLLVGTKCSVCCNGRWPGPPVLLFATGDNAGCSSTASSLPPACCCRAELSAVDTLMQATRVELLTAVLTSTQRTKLPFIANTVAFTRELALCPAAGTCTCIHGQARAGQCTKLIHQSVLFMCKIGVAHHPTCHTCSNR